MERTTIGEGRAWADWAVYVIKSLEQLVAKIEQQSGDFAAFKGKLLSDLTIMKESLRRELNDRKDSDRAHLETMIASLEKMIQNITLRTKSLELQKPEDLVNLKIAELKEETIVPMRLKLALLSSFMGVVGSAVFLLIIKFIENISGL